MITPISMEKDECGGTCLSPQQCQEAENRRIEVQAGLGKKQDPIFKIPRAKKGWEV
jgi:hypothetical protein